MINLKLSAFHLKMLFRAPYAPTGTRIRDFSVTSPVHVDHIVVFKEHRIKWLMVHPMRVFKVPPVKALNVPPIEVLKYILSKMFKVYAIKVLQYVLLK